MATLLLKMDGVSDITVCCSTAGNHQFGFIKSLSTMQM